MPRRRLALAVLLAAAWHALADTYESSQREAPVQTGQGTCSLGAVYNLRVVNVEHSAAPAAAFGKARQQLPAVSVHLRRAVKAALREQSC